VTYEEAKDYVDRRYATAWLGRDPILCPIIEHVGGSWVNVECNLEFSALQLLDERHLVVRRTGLHRILNTTAYVMRCEWPVSLSERVPSIRRGKWGGVLISRETYPRQVELSQRVDKLINFARAYGANLNGNIYEQAARRDQLRRGDLTQVRFEHRVLHDWDRVVGVPEELVIPNRTECRWTPVPP
jgi:hypothetical protein